MKHIKDISENFENSKNERAKNYMFFANLKNIIDYAKEILEMDKEDVDKKIEENHDWANDHISTAKDDIQEVRDFLNSSIKD